MKITRRKLRGIIKEELTMVAESNPAGDEMKKRITDWQLSQGNVPGARKTGTPSANQYDPNGDPHDEYVKLIKRLGPRSFVEGLVWALGDMSGYNDGHHGIIRFIIEEKG